MNIWIIQQQIQQQMYKIPAILHRMERNIELYNEA